MSREEIKYLVSICTKGFRDSVEPRILQDLGYSGKTLTSLTCSFVKSQMQERKRTQVTNQEILLFEKHLIVDEFGFITGFNEKIGNWGNWDQVDFVNGLLSL